MNNLSGTYCFSHRSFSTTKLPLRKSICSRKSYPYLKQVIFFIFLKCKITEILHWFKEKIPPVRYNKKEDDNRHPLLMSGYCDSNTGPSGPKPDALANCATPRIGLQR